MLTRYRFSAVIVALTLCWVVPCAQADWTTRLKDLLGSDSAAPAVDALSQSEVADGLRAALGQGVRNAVAELGREDGFLANADLRIPVPKHLRTLERGLRAIGKDDVADAFVTSLNRAAERAVPATGEVLADAVSKMSIEDARGILNGGDTAATDYLRRTSHADLQDRVRPLVDDAVRQAGVTARYQALLDRAGPAAQLVDTDKLDLSRYVTDRALDGLYSAIGAEEQRIRANPAARTTELLRKVFAR
ncbi:MAG: DUF4197 domain-containing protein [Gammaproteobacteria bacterium]|nr:DUF4197 domain-containing protein [Gammaproteobacteria bacterium]MCP5198584.1 DUF4197 domain-containing protein [Gammaproteobacteria bacterium]